MDCGPTCLRMVGRFYGQHYTLEQLRETTFLGKQGVSLLNLAEAAEQLGFRTEAVVTDFDTLRNDVLLPCIAHWRDRHYVVVYRITRKYVYVADPATGKLRYSWKEFLSGWQSDQQTANNQPDMAVTQANENQSGSGILLLLEPTPPFYEKDTQTEPRVANGWNLLLPFFRPYHRYIGQLLLSVLAIGLIQLVFPFLAQALVDEGIRNNNLHFIYIILIAQLVLFISQTIGEIIRSYLLLHIGNRVSISLLSNFLQKLMRLPYAFFEQKNLGDLFQRITDN